MGQFRAARFEIDTREPQRLNGDEYYLAGWFLPDRDRSNGQRLLLEMDGVLTAVMTGLRRNDVAECFRDTPEAAESGFIVRFHRPKLHPGVRLVLQDGNELVTIAHFAVPAGSSGNARAQAEDLGEEIGTSSRWSPRNIRTWLSALSYRPVFSVVVTAQGTNRYLLTRCLASLLDQQYATLQVVLALNGVRASSVLAHVNTVAASDERLHVIRHAQPVPVRDCFADAMSQVTGDYVIWMREDDELHPRALIELAQYLNGSSERPEIVYFDERHIDVYGNRAEPVLKSDFDKEKLVSFNYVGCATAIRRDVLSDAGDLSTLADKEEFWDLIVRLAENRHAPQVQHIPKILYHRRTYNSATSPPGFAPFGHAGIEVIANHIKRTGKHATAEPGLLPGSVRTRYIYPPQTRLAVFLRVQDGPWQHSLLKDKADRHTTEFYQLNGSLVRALGTDPGMPVIDLREIHADVLLFINGPVDSVNHFFFDELIGQAMRPDCGLVTGISLDVKRRVLHAGFDAEKDGKCHDRFEGITFPVSTTAPDLDLPRSVHSVAGHFFALRSDILSCIGGLPAISDSNSDRVAHSLTLKAREQGLHVLVTPYAIATFDFFESRTFRNPVSDTTTATAALVRANRAHV